MFKALGRHFQNSDRGYGLSRIDDQRAAKQTSTKKEDIESLLAQISGVNGTNRRMFNQRVSLQELNQAEQPTMNKTVNQSHSDSNLQKMKKKSKKVFYSEKLKKPSLGEKFSR